MPAQQEKQGIPPIYFLVKAEFYASELVGIIFIIQAILRIIYFVSISSIIVTLCQPKTLSSEEM